MVKVILDQDDWYAWFPNTGYGVVEVDVPASTIARWERVISEFNEVQTEMEEAANG